jgi:hypothetical protein
MLDKSAVGAITRRKPVDRDVSRASVISNCHSTSKAAVRIPGKNGDRDQTPLGSALSANHTVSQETRLAIGRIKTTRLTASGGLFGRL